MPPYTAPNPPPGRAWQVHRALAVGLAGLALPLVALAGRPLSTDDAGTADPGTCQLEGWYERTGDDRAWVVSPACGIAPGWELGVEAALPQPRRGVSAQLGLAVKWAPQSWSWQSEAGEVRFGFKGAAATYKPQGGGWRGAGQEVLGLASWSPSDVVQVHLNFGGAHDDDARTSASVANLAVSMNFAPAWQAFAEVQTNSRREVFGPTFYQSGVRYWLQPERLGLDLTVGRAQGGGPSTWTFGFGWYGLGE